MQECSGMFRLTARHCLLFCPHYAVPLILPIASLHLISISSPYLAWRSSLMPLSACCSCAHSCMSKLFLGNGAGAPSLGVRSRKHPAPFWPSGLVRLPTALSNFPVYLQDSREHTVFLSLWIGLRKCPWTEQNSLQRVCWALGTFPERGTSQWMSAFPSCVLLPGQG